MIKWHAAWLKYHVSRCIMYTFRFSREAMVGIQMHAELQRCPSRRLHTYLHFSRAAAILNLIRSFSHQSTSIWGGCILFNSWRRGSLTALGQSWPICKLPSSPRENAFSQDGWQLMWPDSTTTYLTEYIENTITHCSWNSDDIKQKVGLFVNCPSLRGEMHSVKVVDN